jgi:transposase
MGSGEGPRSGRAKRRTFTAAYKARIVREYDQMTDPGERGALLRREGLYTSHISQWRRVRDDSAEKVLSGKPAGRPGRSAADAENELLRKENEKLAAELARTKAVLEVAGKAHALLELLSEGADSDVKRQK